MHRHLALGALAGAVLSFLPLGPARAQQAEPAFPTLTVTGQGEASVTPDERRISFAVITEGETVGSALSDNSQRARRVIDALKRRGLNEEDIQTTNFSINPRYSQRKGDQPPEIIGYRVSNQVRVRTEDLEAAGELIEAGVEAGANSVSGIQFTASDEAAVYDEAVAGAAADAKRKARALAEAAGVRLVRIVSIDLEPSYRPIGGGQVRSMMAMESGAPPIEPGEIQSEARVRIVYQISEG
jgi:uncharacterized protein YggE